MSVVLDTLATCFDPGIFAIYDELQAYYNIFLLQIGAPQCDYIPSGGTQPKQALHMVLSFIFIWVHLWHTRLLRIRPCSARDQRSLRCIRVRNNAFIAQAPAPHQQLLNISEAPTEPSSIGRTVDQDSHARPSSPGGASKVSTGPVQGGDTSDPRPTDSPVTRSDESISTTHSNLSPRGFKPTIQTGICQLISEDYAPTHTPAPSADVVPLQRTLEQGTSNHPRLSGVDFYDISSLNVLVIAKGDNEGDRPLRGPKLDTDYIIEECRGLSDVLVASVSDLDTTLEGVDEALECLWRRAQKGSHLVILLTGHGGDTGIILAHDKEIDAQYIQERLGKLNKSIPRDLWVTVAFDICRDQVDLHKVAPDMGCRVSLVWSCSLGQQAGSLEFQPPRVHDVFDLLYHLVCSWLLSWWHPSSQHSLSPGSGWLLAAAKAYQDVSENKGSFEECLKRRMTQLARFRSYIYHTSVLNGKPNCLTCVRDEVWCPDAFIVLDQFAQDIDVTLYQSHSARLLEFLQQRSYTPSLPGVASRFFLTLDSFEKRSKYRSQFLYLLHSPTDFGGWRGWLKWFWGLVWLRIQAWANQGLRLRHPIKEAHLEVDGKQSHPISGTELGATTLTTGDCRGL